MLSKKRKAGGSSRTPDIVIYKIKYIAVWGKVKEKLQEKWAANEAWRESAENVESGSFLGAGFAGKRERALGVLGRELRNTCAEHGFESVLGSLEKLFGLAVALLGVLQMGAQSCELVGEFFHLLFHPGKAFQEALGIFFHLHAAKAHGDHAKMGVEGIRRNGNDAFIAAVSVEGLALVVLRLQKLVIDGFRRNEHQGHIERAFIWHNVFFGDGVGMAFHSGGEGPARFFTFGADSAIGIEWEFGINGHQFFVAKLDDGVGGFSAGKTILHLILRARKVIFVQALEGGFTQGAAGLGASQNAFVCLRGLGHLLPRLLLFAVMQLILADLIARVLELAGHLGLRVGGNLAGDLGGVFDGLLQSGGD